MGWEVAPPSTAANQAVGNLPLPASRFPLPSPSPIPSALKVEHLLPCLRQDCILFPESIHSGPAGPAGRDLIAPGELIQLRRYFEEPAGVAGCVGTAGATPGFVAA
jgi:hypothetical protein